MLFCVVFYPCTSGAQSMCPQSGQRRVLKEQIFLHLLETSHHFSGRGQMSACEASWCGGRSRGLSRTLMPLQDSGAVGCGFPETPSWRPLQELLAWSQSWRILVSDPGSSSSVQGRHECMSAKKYKIVGCCMLMFTFHSKPYFMVLNASLTETTHFH